jgi:hypothetical protein
MCRDCRNTTAFVRVNDDVVAEVTYDNYEYDEYAEYTDQELDERIGLKVVNLWMTRKALKDNIQEVFI